MRRKPFPILLPMILLGFRAQTQQFNTRIDTVNAEVLNIIGNRKVVIGTIIMPSTNKPKILLYKASQHKDSSSGEYMTEFLFKTPDNTPFLAVNIILKFNTPVTFVRAAGFGGTSYLEQQAVNAEKDLFQYKASQVNADSLKFIVRSRGKIFTTIYGIDGSVRN